MPEPNTQPTVTNSDFLRELAQSAPRGSSLWVTAFAGSPDLTDARNWHGRPYNVALDGGAVDGWSDRNAYFCVAALSPTADGEVRRRKANFARLLALVVDDASPEDLIGSVSYVLETSPGKRQIGILLDGTDPDAADAPLINALVTSLAEKGLVRADPGGNNAVRYVRLPCGVNQKPRDSGHFAHRMQVWAPHVRLTLEDAAACFGVDLDSLRKAKEQPASSMVARAQDEFARMLAANIVRGERLHDSINELAASAVACGAAPGFVVNMLRGLMEASVAPHDERWLARYQDIPRSVTTAQEKFARKVPLPTQEADDSPYKLKRSAVDFGRLKPIEWVLDGFLAARQVAVFAGQPGVGKSTVFSSMALLVAGYGQQMGSDIVVSHPRRVVIVSEHAEQYERLFYGLGKRFGIAPAELAHRVILFDAARLEPREVPFEVLRLIQEAAGEMPPLVILDTASATFDLADENSNAEVGAMLAGLKAPVMASGAPLWVIAHAAKALGREDAEITPRGASAYIGDVQATGSVFRDKNFPSSTFIKSLKNRNEREFGEIEVRTEVVWHSVTDQWGEIQQVGIRLGVPMRSGETTRREAAEEVRETQREAHKAERSAEIDREILDVVDAGIRAGELFGQKGLLRAVRDVSRKREQDIRERIDALVAAGDLVWVDCPKDLRPAPQTARVLLRPQLAPVAYFSSIREARQ